MKGQHTLFLLCLFFLTNNCALAQLTPLPTKPWYAKIKIVGEDGQPVSDAKVHVSYTIPPYSSTDNPKYHGEFSGFSDTNGFYAAEHDDRSDSIGVLAQKEGYYSTRISYRLGDPEQYPDRRNISLTLLLKKIGKPIAMYAKHLNTHVPDLDKPVGFDLVIGDWISPYGKGTNADINFTGHFDKHDNESDFTLTVTFPNAGDGIQEFTVPASEKTSELRSPHEAPADGYKQQWVQFDNRKPNTKIKTNRDLNRNYFFRVQTKLDEKGNVASACYGKIYGDFMNFTYFLNPTPNDRNIEFSQNLFRKLKFDEGVNAP